MTEKKWLCFALSVFVLAVVCFLLVSQLPLGNDQRMADKQESTVSTAPVVATETIPEEAQSLSVSDLNRIVRLFGVEIARVAIKNPHSPKPSIPASTQVHLEATSDLSTLGQMEMNGKTTWGFTDKVRNTSFFVAEGEGWGPWFLKSVKSTFFVFVKEGNEYALPR